MISDTLITIERLGGDMGDFELSDKQKDEFLNLSVIKDNFVNCWFEDQKLIMPSGQGKTLKGVVLASLEVFKIQQAKIGELQERIDLFDKMILSLRNEFNLWADDTESFNAIEAQIENLEELSK